MVGVTLETTARLLAVLALVQGAEFLCLTRVTGNQGVWRWPDLEKELGAKFRYFLTSESFNFLNIVRILAALSVMIMPNAVGLLILLTLHILTLLRFLGGFNGGSDYMNLMLLLVTSLGLLTDNSAFLWFIVFQACLSYWKAGYFKLKNAQWRNGSALCQFLNSTTYELNLLCAYLTKSAQVSKLASWLVITFELSFPIGLLHPRVAIFYIGMGILFHLVNAYIFGLNRFVFAWLATYPSLYYCSLVWPF